MATKAITAVPLCLPENWTVKDKKTTWDKLKGRGNMKLFDEGKRLLEDIGDEKVVVICITGPARSGKSYLLSQLVDGVSFEVGHNVFPETTGIWAACSKSEVIQGSEKARILLLDAEGFGGVTTKDGSISEEWNTKLFALCCLLSSVLIYNSQNIPNLGDLERLQFVANYSKLVWSDCNDSDTFKESVPDFIWVLRDAQLDPRDVGFEDWKDYLEKELFGEQLQTSPSDTSFKSIVNAFRTFFHSKYDVKAISPPSADRIVCKNLDKPENAAKIGAFLRDIEDVKKTIQSRVNIKTAYGTSMTGKRLLSLIQRYCDVLNEKCDKMAVKPCWDATIAFHLQSSFQKACRKLSEDVDKIKMPIKVEEIQRKHDEVAESTKNFFKDDVNVKDEAVIRPYITELEEKINYSFVSMKKRLNHTSRLLCRTEGNEIVTNHFKLISEQMLSKSSVEHLHLYDNVTEKISDEYREKTDGWPKSEEVLETVRREAEQMSLLKKELTIREKISENYNLYMSAVNLPIEEKELKYKHDTAQAKAFASCEEVVSTYLSNYDDFKAKTKEQIADLYTNFTKTNYEQSRRDCETLMKTILQDDSLQKYIKKPSLFHSIYSKDEKFFLNNYTDNAIGPAKDEIREELGCKLKKLLETAKAARSEVREEFKNQAITIGKYSLGVTVLGGGFVGVGLALTVPALSPVAGVCATVAAFSYLGYRYVRSHPYRHEHNQQQASLPFQSFQ